MSTNIEEHVSAARLQEIFDTIPTRDYTCTCCRTVFECPGCKEYQRAGKRKIQRLGFEVFALPEQKAPRQETWEERTTAMVLEKVHAVGAWVQAHGYLPNLPDFNNHVDGLPLSRRNMYAYFQRIGLLYDALEDLGYATPEMRSAAEVRVRTMRYKRLKASVERRKKAEIPVSEEPTA